MTASAPKSASRRAILTGALGAVGASVVAAAAADRDDADSTAHRGFIHTQFEHGGVSHVHKGLAHDHAVMAHALDEETIRKTHRPSTGL